MHARLFILDFSKIESGELVLDEIKFDVHALVEGVADSLQALAKNKELQIQDAINRPFPFGLAMSPLAYHVKDELNSNEKLLDALEEVMQKFDVLQLYIDLKVGKTKSYQKYTIIPFAEGRFKFHSTTSVNQPTRNKFSVKMVK